LDITVHAAGEVVPALEVLDGSVATSPRWDTPPRSTGKARSWRAYDGAVGLTLNEHVAWSMGGGQALMKSTRVSA
jgi:TRAP-type mannitol/chloroaromatic compound transport system substrate-binding protein